MKLAKYSNDLRFVIGAFLFLIGGVVLLAHVFGGNAEVQGVQINLFGGGMLALTGTALALSVVFGSESK